MKQETQEKVTRLCHSWSSNRILRNS